MSSMKKSKDTLKQMKMRYNNPKSVGHWEGSPKREIHSITCLSQKEDKAQKQSNFKLMGTWKRTKNKAQSEQKEGNNEDQSRNHKRVYKQDTKINESKSFFEKKSKIDKNLIRLIKKK